MNEQAIQARIAELNQERAKAITAIQTLDGAIADCHWFAVGCGAAASA